MTIELDNRAADIVAAVELVAENILELLLELELVELKLVLAELELKLADKAAAEGALMEVVLHRLLAMGYLLQLHLPMLKMRQRLVLFLHTPH